MRRFTLFLIFLTLLVSNSISGQKPAIIVVEGDTINLAKDTIIGNKLVSLNLQQFNGKTVDQVLKNDTIRLYKEYWFSNEPPLKLRSLNLTFARGLYLRIYFDTLEYQARFSRTGHSFEKIRKEKISTMELDKAFFEENVVKEYSKTK